MDRLNMTVETGSRWSRKLAIVVLTSAYLTTGLAPAYASDTEVYARKLSVTTELAPTLMMMIDTSGSMLDCLEYSGKTCTKTRIHGLLNAMQKVLFGSETDNVKPIPGYVRLGFSRYNPDANKGGWVKYPARPLDAFTGINPDGEVVSQPLAGDSDASQPAAGTLSLSGTELVLGKHPVGIRFPTVNVPKGATINDAYIEFKASSSSAASTVYWEFEVHDVADSPVFAGGANDVNSRPYSTIKAVFKNDDAWVKDSVYKVPVLAPVSYMANRADWCGGNAMTFRVTDVGGANEMRSAYSFEGGAANAPRLVINYTIDPKATDSCIFAPFTARAELAIGNDDIEYLDGSSTVTRNANNLRFSLVSGGKRNHVALRFPKLDKEVYRGATIDEALLIGTGYANINSVPTVQVTAFNHANLPSFCSSATVCSVPTAGVFTDTLWSPGKITSGATYSINLTTQMQQLVNLAGWTPTSALGFRMRSNVTNSSTNGAFYSAESASTARRTVISVKGRQRFTDLSKLKTVREEIWEELQGMEIAGGTPLGAAYVETMRYMLGVDRFVELYDPRVVTADAKKYVTPITPNSQCSGNYVFAMTDGEPNNLAQVGTNTKEVIGQTCPSGYSSYVYGTQQQENWRCMLATAEWGLKPTNQLKTRIRTNTVLFGDDDANTLGNMKQVAKFGGGAFYKAGDEASLVNALVETVNSLLDVSGTITAPGVAVNQLNRLNNLDQLFYAVFDPDVQKAFWPGNVKRYRLDIANELVLDVNGKQAVDPATSFFKSDAQSWWSPAIDGDKARLGGAASVLPPPESRKLFTYTGALPSGSAALTPVDLGNAGFVAAGKAVTGIADDNAFKNLVNWYKGYQIESLFDGLVTVGATTLLRNEMGGALHSRPILVSYGYSGSASDAATNAELQDNTVFFSTLEGTLHAIDAKTGKELFGFIPGEKLAVLPKLFLNPNQENPEFGMDLTWSVFRKDGNGDGKIGAGDKVYIYGGMRMGGRNYYALDVTDRTTPKLLFAIRGGSGAFAGMGQTWSQPVTGALKVNGTVRNVLVFGGGYDPQHETENVVFTADTMGNQLYIVDAETGALIWSASNSGATMTVADMKFSVPMAPKPVDINADGLIDHIYFADLGGQVFRVDVDNGNGSASTLVKRVRKIASLAGNTVATQRRFYEPPTVALFADPNGKYFAGVGLGSGYRSHPLNEATTDHFFVLFDYDVPRADILTATTFQDEINMTKLAEAEVGSSTIDMAGKLGWYLDFSDVGEKVITSGVFFRNTLIFSSYVPSVEGGDSCSPVIGRSKLYSICVLGGALCGNSETAITVKDNAVLGLGGDPQMIFLPDPNDPTKSNVGIITGTDVEKFGEGVAAGLRRTRWMEKTPQN